MKHRIRTVVGNERYVLTLAIVTASFALFGTAARGDSLSGPRDGQTDIKGATSTPDANPATGQPVGASLLGEDRTIPPGSSPGQEETIKDAAHELPGPLPVPDAPPKATDLPVVAPGGDNGEDDEMTFSTGTVVRILVLGIGGVVLLWQVQLRRNRADGLAGLPENRPGRNAKAV